MKYTISLALLTVTLCYSILVNILFYGKKHIKTKETNIFGKIAITNLIGILLEMGCIIFLNVLGTDNIISIIINKSFLIYFIIILMLFSLYVVHVAELDDDKNNFNKQVLLQSIKNSIIVLTIASSIGVCFFKTNLFIDGDITYSYGPSVNIVYAMAGLCSLGCIFYLILNLKKLKQKRNIPILAFVVLMGVSTIIQQLFPEITLATSAETLIIFLMFHTIENPDLKMISELKLARDQADKANNAKTDFLSSMSHEIRTPLNAIVGFSDCIMEAKDLQEAQENAKDIINAGQTLLEIVNGILDISKIEAGKLEIINSRYDAPEVFMELAKLISTRMAEKGLDFSYYIAPDVPKTLYGDHANIKKIITNLLSNACKYTDTGFVRFEVNCVNMKDYTRLIISVEDSGRGIKKESVNKLFTKFQRLDEDRNTTIEGTGLGLAITKQLTELMGGKVIVHTVYGEGSKFTVVINQRIATKEEKEKAKIKDTLDLTNVKILVVDDAPLNLKVTEKLLSKYNANSVVLCGSGFECLDRINSGEVYDLILLDDMMPKMSGVITLQKLKENPNFKTPTVALTANAISGMREKYLQDGFDDYLAKPIEKEELIRVINQLLGRTYTKDLQVIKEETNNKDNAITQEEEESKKNEIIPVEDNVEKELLKQDKLNDEEDIQKKESTEIVEKEEESNIIPVVDINPPTTNEVVYDQKYLEENGANLEKALELLGDMDMYNSTIQSFLEDVEDKWNNIINYKNANDMENYSILVHSLKSDCKYLGFYSLADIAYQHELKSKDNDSEFVNHHFEELEKEYKRVLEVVKNYCSNL